MIDSLRVDVRDALRGFRGNPLFACGVACTIGFGLGFLCAAFTVINGYLLKPLDIRDPHGLYEVSWDTAATRRHVFNVDEFEALVATTGVFRDVMAFAGFQVAHEDGPMDAQMVTGNYFAALGVEPFIGRVLQEDDARQQGERAVVVLSHDAWNVRYDGDPSIIGKSIRLGRGEYTVVGVAQPGFLGFGDAAIGVWVPVTMAGAFPARNPYAPERPHMFAVFARLRDGITPQTAAAWFDVWVKQRFATAAPEDRPTMARVEPRATRIPITGRTASMFSAILAAFSLVLLIACANVANMMLARGVGRQREIAVRLSLGARRSRIVRQLLVESVLLAAPAAVVAFALTFAASRLVPALILNTWPAGLPPLKALLAPLDPDIRVLLFLVLSALASAVLFGLVPAFHTSRTSLSRASRGEFGESVRVSRLRSGLVVAQVAACAVFLVTALAVLVELRRLATVETGLDLDGVVDLRVPANQRAAVAARLALDPRVEQIAATWRPPLYGPLRNVLVRPSGSSEALPVGFTVVSPEYFELFRVRLLRGRVFTREEAETRADVAIVSNATARRLWPGADALGQTIAIDDANRQTPGMQRRLLHKQVRVIGIAPDVIGGSLMAGIDPTCVYFPTALVAADETALLVRARTDLRAAGAAITAATTAVREDAAFPVYPLPQVVALQIWALRVFSATVLALGLVALVLAVSGTYGVVAYIVTQRTREFGIRMALGATASSIVRGVVTGAVRLGAIGVAIGAAVALALSRVLPALIETPPLSAAPPYFLGAAVVLAATAAAASIPSLHAAQVDPAAALRAE
jgi:predicted permease